MIQSHRDLVAWQKAFALGTTVHKVTKLFPKEELYGLTSQVRRASISIASNVAEGYGRGTTQDYLRFLRVARGSTYEVDTQILFALEFGYIDSQTQQQVEQEVNETGRVLAGLIRSIEANQN